MSNKISSEEKCDKTAKKDPSMPQLHLALKFIDVDNYLFVYIDQMKGNFYKLPKCDNIGFSRSSPDRFWIIGHGDFDEIKVMFPFNNEYMSRATVFDCGGEIFPREMEYKIVNLISNEVFKSENLVDKTKLNDKVWKGYDDGWRSYEWIADV